MVLSQINPRSCSLNCTIELIPSNSRQHIQLKFVPSVPVNASSVSVQTVPSVELGSAFDAPGFELDVSFEETFAASSSSPIGFSSPSSSSSSLQIELLTSLLPRLLVIWLLPAESLLLLLLPPSSGVVVEVLVAAEDDEDDGVVVDCIFR